MAALRITRGWRHRTAAVIGVLASACAQLVDLGPERTLAEGGAAGQGGSDGGAGGSGGLLASGCASDAAVLWIERFGDDTDQDSRAIVADGEGGAYIAGNFAGVLELGGEPLESVGGRDLFLARIDREGRVLWNRRFGDYTDQSARLELALTHDGVILGGQLIGNADFGDGQHGAKGLDDGFVARYTAAGDLLWTQLIGGEGRQEVQDVAYDPLSDTTFATGAMEQTVDIDGTVLTAAGLRDGYLLQLDGAGQHVFSRRFGGPGEEAGTAVAVDADGRVILGGSGNSPIDLGDGEVPLSSNGDAFAAAYDAAHTPIWVEHIGGSGGQAMRAIGLSSSGQLVLAGALWGSTSFCGRSISSAYGGFFSLRDALSSDCVAETAIVNFTNMRTIVFDPRGDIVVAGFFLESTDFGDGIVYSGGAQDGVVARLAPNLSPRSVVRFGAGADDDVAGAVVDGEGVLVFGDFRQTVFVEGCPPMTSAGGSDLFLARLR